MEMRGQALTVIVFFELLIWIFLSIVPPTFASPFTVVTIELEEIPVGVDVSPGSSGIVDVSGNVTCLKLGPDSVKVSLAANSSTGGASVLPPSFVFSGTSGTEETEPFTASTRVPVGTSCTESGQITVSGIWTQGGLQETIEPVSSTFTIEQYYKINMFIGDRDYTIKSGENVDFDVTLNNHGNGNDVVEIDIVNRKDLKKNGLSLPSLKEINMPEGTNKTVNMKIGSSEDTLGRYNIEIFALSKGSQKTDSPVSAHLTVILDIHEQELSERIGSLIVSPMVIGLIIAIILVVIVVKITRG